MPELVWKGKYDENNRKVSPLRVALPFQDVETLNESTKDRMRMKSLFEQGKPTEWRNRLIWGDKKYVLPSLLPEFAGKVNLIYIDPPFATGADFSFKARIPDNPQTDDDESAEFTKQASMIEQKAYRDTWGGGLDSYLKWFYETAVYLHELLAEDGSIYVHCDWHAGHYIKVVMDDVFGYESFKNHITWKRSSPRGNAGTRYPELTDYILFLTKTDQNTWNSQFVAYRDEYEKKYYSYTDEKTGRLFQPTSILGHSGINPIYEWRGRTKPWRYPKHRLDELDSAGLLYWPPKGDVPRLKRFLDEQKGSPVQSLWVDIPPVNSQANEAINYDTQKLEALLERIITASSNEGDLVLDCFCGSGTTPAVAEKLGRRWITADLGRFAIHTARKRLLEIEGVNPFVIQNLGKYERQLWQGAQFGESNNDRQRAYRKFILELYRAEPLEGGVWIHGLHKRRAVHVGSVDSPVTEADVTSIAAEFRASIGKGKTAPQTNGIDILGWDFAFEINEIVRDRAIAAGLDLSFKKIPIDVMDSRAVNQGDIKFYELAALVVKQSVKGKTLTIELTDFIIPQDDLPEEVRGKITHWSQWIDYWAVDWDYKDDTFHNQWQAYRTKKEPDIELKTTHTYDGKGKFAVLIKVVDILGNDTTKLIEAEVG